MSTALVTSAEARLLAHGIECPGWSPQARAVLIHYGILDASALDSDPPPPPPTPEEIADERAAHLVIDVAELRRTAVDIEVHPVLPVGPRPKLRARLRVTVAYHRRLVRRARAGAWRDATAAIEPRDRPLWAWVGLGGIGLLLVLGRLR